MRFWIALHALAVACLLVFAPSVGAAAPEDIHFQGQLYDSAGDPLVGPVEIEIGVWDQPGGGVRLYWEAHPSVDLIDGVFSILLGAGSVLAGSFDAGLFANETRYLQVVVDGEELTRRQPFSSAAYALQAGHASAAQVAGDADTLDGLDSTDFVDAGSFAAHEAAPSAHHAPTTSFNDLADVAADS